MLPGERYATAYDRAHSKKAVRPQRELYRKFGGAGSGVKAPAPASQRYFSIYDSSYRARRLPVSYACPSVQTGFRRNSHSSIAAFLRPPTPANGEAPPVSEYREAFAQR